jgi:hypothetical protein
MTWRRRTTGSLCVPWRLGALVVFASSSLLAGCAGGPAPAATSVRPSPTIAAAQPVEPALAPAPAPVQPTATIRALPVATANPDVFSYVWPAYLPSGMVPAPRESRVARANELGTTAAGFFLVTFNGDAGKRKIVLGGGSVEPFAITGDQKILTLGGREATLTTAGDQRLLNFKTQPDQGSLFVLGIGVDESELLLVAESLLPIDPADMRQRTGL